MITKRDIPTPSQVPTEYSKEVCDNIFTELSNSHKGLDTICREFKISASKFREFIVTNTEAGTNYAHARSLQVELLENKITDLTFEMAAAIKNNDYSPEMVNAAVQALKVQIDAIKWVLSKLLPKKYGDKVDVTSNGKTLPTSINIILDNGGNCQP